MMRCIVLGAGRTGRGFIARLLCDQAGIVFIDRDAELIDRLNATKRYTIRYFDGSPETIVGDYEAFHTEDPRCADLLNECDAIFMSVRGENAPAAGAWLNARLSGPKCVIACENAAAPASLLSDALRYPAASGAIFCTTIEDGPLDIRSENYPDLPVSAYGGTEVIASLKGLVIEPDFDLLMRRKIYTYNGASGIIAYLGAMMGIQSYPAAANNPEITARLDAFYAAINAALCAEYGIDEEAQRTFAAFSKVKFQNEAISDTVQRNAASPERKLAAAERIIAPARLILKYGGDASPLIETAAALRYMGLAGKENAENALRTVCGLSAKEWLYRAILETFLES